jgi:uncharacterized protein (TIGR00369 family)
LFHYRMKILSSFISSYAAAFTAAFPQITTEKDRPNLDKLPNYERCFVCGDRNPSGLSVRFRTDGEQVFTTFTPREQHVGFHGTTHGGILAALLDETMGWAPSVVNRRFCLCVELTVEYRKPVPLGMEVTVTGRVVSDRRRIWETAGDIRDAAGTVYARGKGRYVPVSDEQTRVVADYLTFDAGCLPPERICRAAGLEDSRTLDG